MSTSVLTTHPKHNIMHTRKPPYHIQRLTMGPLRLPLFFLNLLLIFTSFHPVKAEQQIDQILGNWRQQNIIFCGVKHNKDEIWDRIPTLRSKTIVTLTSSAVLYMYKKMPIKRTPTVYLLDMSVGRESLEKFQNEVGSPRKNDLVVVIGDPYKLKRPMNQDVVFINGSRALVSMPFCGIRDGDKCTQYVKLSPEHLERLLDGGLSPEPLPIYLYQIEYGLKIMNPVLYRIARALDLYIKEFPRGKDVIYFTDSFNDNLLSRKGVVSSQAFYEDHVSFIFDEALFRMKHQQLDGPTGTLMASLHQLALPLENEVWLGVGATLTSALAIFLIIGLLFPRNRKIFWSPFSYAGRKLLEVFVVIRWPLKRDCSTGKGVALVLKTGLAIIFVPYIQLLIKRAISTSFGYGGSFFAEPSPFEIFGVKGLDYMPVADPEVWSLVTRDPWRPWYYRREIGLAKQHCYERYSYCEKRENYIWLDWDSNTIPQSLRYGYKKARSVILKRQFKLAAFEDCGVGCEIKLQKFDRLGEAGILDHIIEQEKTMLLFRYRDPYFYWHYYTGPMVISGRTVLIFFELLLCGFSIAAGSFAVEKMLRRRKSPIYPTAFPLREFLILTIAIAFGDLAWGILQSSESLLSVIEICVAVATFLALLFRHRCQRSVTASKRIEILDTIIWILLTLIWYGIGVAHWILGNRLFTFRAIPSIIVSMFTPL